MTLTVGSLFSGIGGIDLGLERAGMTIAWQSEVDPYACRVLAKHWPDTPNLGDITAIDWSTVERVDVLCGGYPCQPFSLAGSRHGEHDSRHLWPFFLDAIRALRPRYALLENVPGHLSLGFGRVLGDLAESGYDAQWDCIPAATVGAPHRRDRVFIVAGADTESERRTREVVSRQDVERHGLQPAQLRQALPDAYSQELRLQSIAVGRRRCAAVAGDDGPHGLVADTDGGGRQGRTRQGVIDAGWPQPAHRSWWTVEPDVGRVAHGVPARMDRLRALGNAVVPQVAEHVGRMIVQAAA